MTKGISRLRPLLTASSAALALASCTQAATDMAGDPIAVAPVAQGNPDQLLWGDLHLHTNLSFDAYSFGTQNFGPEQAYRFARGEEVTSVTGQRAKLARPLDFLMVSDHAEFLGVLRGIGRDDPLIMQDSTARRWAGFLAKGELTKVVFEFVDYTTGKAPADPLPEDYTRSIWSEVVRNAERFNEPGKFTALIGYEWTAMRTGDNLHRVVVFEDDAQKTLQTLPFSAVDSNDPERLWDALARYQNATGGRVMSIPHNGNLSEGSMFGAKTEAGLPFSRAYRQRRLRFEPVAEITQVKGDSEAHPLLSPEDEFADFETWDEADIELTPRSATGETLRAQLRGEYARPALKEGLGWAARDGANPYAFGLIGSTDAHTGLSAAAEDNFFGKFPDSEPAAARLTNASGGVLWRNARLAASGYVAVWARANTRSEIFSALARREVYASTGPRIALRMFGGWDFAPDTARRADFVDQGYARGVPMGGTLHASRHKGAPTFVIVATKDPDGANLDRVQVVKGWRDARGQLHERVYDVALSGGRRVDPVTGKAPAVGTTVDLATATYTNAIGAPELRAQWRDPDFDPAEQAFYYLRALQIPTPRWSTYDAVRYGVARPDGVPATIQDRAYSSPIWFRADL